MVESEREKEAERSSGDLELLPRSSSSEESSDDLALLVDVLMSGHFDDPAPFVGDGTWCSSRFSFRILSSSGFTSAWPSASLIALRSNPARSGRWCFESPASVAGVETPEGDCESPKLPAVGGGVVEVEVMRGGRSSSASVDVLG